MYTVLRSITNSLTGALLWIRTITPPSDRNQIANSQPFTPPRPQPEWQQGLGGVPTQPQGQQVPPSAGNLSPAMPGQPGELPTPNPVSEGQPQPQQWTPPVPSMPPAAPAITAPTPAMGAGVPPAGTRSPRRILGLLAGLLVAVLLIGGGVYWFTSRNSDNDTSSNGTSAGSVDLATLGHVTMVSPGNIDGYKERQTGTASIKDFLATDGSCELIVGTTTAAQLPGSDLNAIIQPQLDQLKKSGATVKGPSNGSTLTLVNVDDASKTYSLPTLKFEFSQDKKHAAVHYSAVILQSGDRVVINRSCVNQSGDVDMNKLSNLDAKAKDIKVMVDQK